MLGPRTLLASSMMIQPESITKAFALAAFFLGLSFADTSHADSLRCGNQLALEGNTRLEVRAKCGEPADIVHSTLARRTTFVSYRNIAYAEEEAIIVPVEVWMYNFGPHRFMYRLRFVGGILEGLEPMGYGFEAANPK
jgi:hypothetical protein